MRAGNSYAQLHGRQNAANHAPASFSLPKKGYLGLPTVVNNVETFCAAARVVELGTDFFLQTGQPDFPGTRC
jgi:NADH:ubiquinone oxidoreductase subunit F (NADH-binding)